MISALDPLSMNSPSVTSYAFRSLDGSENKRTGDQYGRIAQYQMSENVTSPQYSNVCAPGIFGLKPKPVGNRNLALEDALDGRRQKTYDYLPQDVQDKIRGQEINKLQALSDASIPSSANCTTSNDWLTPVNTHVAKYHRGGLVTDIQVTRNDTLALQAPMNYINANRPQYGISSRENAKMTLARTQNSMKGMERIQKHAQKIQASGLVWNM